MAIVLNARELDFLFWFYLKQLNILVGKCSVCKFTYKTM